MTDAVEDEVRRIESVLSRFDPTSEISRLNRQAAKEPVRVSVELWDLLLVCEEARERMDGCFDVAAGSFTADKNVCPTPRVIFDAANRSIRYASPETRIDLGGVGKGYALDRVAGILSEFGIGNGLLNAGTSSVLALGGHPSGADWPIDIRDPDDDTHPPIARIHLVNRGFSCSASRHPSQSISDICDPATGQPISGCAACAVSAPTALGAEVLSTGLLVMGREAAAEYPIAKRWPARAAWIERGRLHWLAETP